MKTLIIKLLFCSFLCFTFVLADEVYTKTEKANKLYKQGKYEEALKLYEDALLLSPSDNNLKMNRGSALYKMGNYDEAEKSYEATLSEKDKKKRAIAHYNLGNIFFSKGESSEKIGNPAAREQYQKALENYIRALELQPSEKDAKWNLELAYKKIKMLEQQQNESQQNKQQKEQQQQQQQQKDQQTKEDEQHKQQDQKNQQQQEKQQEMEEKEQQLAEEEKKNEKDKKEEAKRIISFYADDADTLNKPPIKKRAREKQPEKDW